GATRRGAAAPGPLLPRPHLAPRANPWRRSEQIERARDEEGGLPGSGKPGAVVHRPVEGDEAIAPRPLDELPQHARRDVLDHVGEELAIEPPIDVAGVHG